MECFTIMRNEIEGRIDPSPYHPIRLNTIKKIKSSGFELLPLKEVVEFKKKIVNSKLKDLIYVGLENIESDTGVFIPSETQKEEFGSAFLFQKGDILFPKLRPYLNKVYLAEFDGVCSTEFHVLKPIKCEGMYLFTFLNSHLVLNQTSYLMTGNTLPRLQTEDIKKLLIPIPPIKIQQRIIDNIKTAYKTKKEKEAEAKRLIESIDDYVLSELGIEMPELEDKMTFSVTADEVRGGRIDPYYYQPKFEEIEEAIENGKFEIKRLKKFITKIHYGASVKNIYVDEGIPLLRILNLKENKIDLRDVVKLPESMRKELGTAFVEEGDLLISRSGTVGLVSVVPKEADGFAFGSFMIKFCLNDEISKNYISIWLNTKLQKLLTEREKIGAIQGNITIGTIENFKIPLPPLKIQNKIAEEVKQRMQKAEQLQKEAKEVLDKAKQEVEEIILNGVEDES